MAPHLLSSVSPRNFLLIFFAIKLAISKRVVEWLKVVGMIVRTEGRTEGSTTAVKDPNYQRFRYVSPVMKLDLAQAASLWMCGSIGKQLDVVGFRRR